ncbi:MAG: bifunctional (p)ppGpp synthetase/guanosine-3',5'-bis(diphosphate) 3'-pyrophosphohydrolase [bacterium]
MGTTYEQLRKLVGENEQKANLELLDRAYELACDVYCGKKAAHGEDVLKHCLEVAAILASLRSDLKTIIGGLLHELYSLYPEEEKLTKLLGGEIAEMAKLLCSVNVLRYSSEDAEDQAEYIRRMFIALARDVRVVLVKLAGRLDVMRNIGGIESQKGRERLARETLQIHAPLAHRLGTSQIRSELEDLAFRHLLPEEYERLSEQAESSKREGEAALKRVIRVLKRIFKDAGIRVHIAGRTKHLYSIYQKMLRQGKDFSELYDLTAVRIIVEREEECYHVLSVLHSLWEPVPGTFDNYIVSPKPNGYQSIHTVVKEPGGELVEVQIRTWEMHAVSEYGVASHWQYKEAAAGGAPASKLDSLIQRVAVKEEDPREFLKNVIIDFQEDRVFAFTPRGKIISLPSGSNPLDFAYRVHTEVGHRCSGARVNGRMVPLDHELRNGDIVEITTRKRARPSRDWLTTAKSPNARSKIRHWFRQANREENIAQGRAMVEREMTHHGLRSRDIIGQIGFESIAKEMSYKTTDDMFAAVGCGDASTESVVNRMKRFYKEKVKQEEAKKPSRVESVLRRQPRPSVVVKGVDGMLINIGRCCLPVPGDRIVGFVSRGRGLTIHRRECSNIRRELEKGERIVEVKWDRSDSRTYISEIEIRSLDRKGLLNDITSIFSTSGINIVEMNTRTLRDSTSSFKMKLEVPDRKALNSVMRDINSMEDIISVKRL